MLVNKSRTKNINENWTENHYFSVSQKWAKENLVSRENLLLFPFFLVLFTRAQSRDKEKIVDYQQIFYFHFSKCICPKSNFAITDKTTLIWMCCYAEYDGTQNFKRYQYRYFFFRYQIFSITVLVLFSGTKFYRYQFRDFFPVPIFTDTGYETFFRYQFFLIPFPIPPKKWTIPGTSTGTCTVLIFFFYL